VQQADWDGVIRAAMGPAFDYLESLPERPVYRPTNPDEIRALLNGPFPERGIHADFGRRLGNRSLRRGTDGDGPPALCPSG